MTSKVKVIQRSKFDIVILCLALESITIVRCVAYNHDLCMTLTFNVKDVFYLCNIRKTPLAYNCLFCQLFP